MRREQRPPIKRKVMMVSSIAILLMSSGIFLELWSVKEMRGMVTEQFNAEQLIIARHISFSLEKEIGLIKQELLLLGKQDGRPFNPRGFSARAQEIFLRLLPRGVWKIEVINIRERVNDVFMPYKPRRRETASAQLLQELAQITLPQGEELWIAPVQVDPERSTMRMGIPLKTAYPGWLIVHIQVNWFVTPLLENIRSGKTGYAWLIDHRGMFLFHPNNDFMGQDSIAARQKAFPDIPLGYIEAIEKEKMLQGQAGTGWFYSGWHQGMQGKIKKLIAFYPVMVARNPQQQWSVAVVAPASEIEGAIRNAYFKQVMTYGFIILIILIGAFAIIVFERQWSVRLEGLVDQRTVELKKSEEKYRSLIESAEDFIFTVDPKGVFQSMNSFMANFFGSTPTSFLGKELAELFPALQAEKMQRLVTTVGQSGKSAKHEFEMEIDANRIWLSAYLMPLRNETGRVSRVLCIARDITENKLLEIQLIHAEKLASMGTLAAGVAHEINNPLGVILGFCDLLLRKKEQNSQEYDDLKTIERQGLHCKKVVENLLSFARLGKSESEYADFNQCIRDIVNVVRHTFEMQQKELTLLLTEDLPKAKGDPRQLQQVFLNLINNSLSALQPGGRLTIKTFPEGSSGKVVISFHDNGSGIKTEHMEHIFEPFFTTKNEGTGLGLFVSYGIVKKYSGSMECTSRPASAQTPGETVFTIKLPALSPN